MLQRLESHIPVVDKIEHTHEEMDACEIKQGMVSEQDSLVQPEAC